jgi:hypothetical protein
VRVPKTTLDQIGQWVDALGVRRSHFLGIALVAGSRLLVRACSPETLMVRGAMKAFDEMDAVLDHNVSRDEDYASNSVQTSQEAVQSVIPELKAEIGTLRAEIASLQDRLAHAERPRKGHP